MSNKNQHILDYLKYYCDLGVAPGYAVLLKGSWGSGKTWLIKKFIEDNEKEPPRFIYVSLYGVTSFREIETAIFQQLHPILGSKAGVFLGKVAKGLLKTTVNIDLNNDGKSDGSVGSAMPDINLSEFMVDTKTKILVFDDLERCSIKIKDVLGYINHFVEHQDGKVILLADSGKIEAREDKGGNSEDESIEKYKRIKEKLIGKEFSVVSDFESAVNDFVESLSDDGLKAFIGRHFTEIHKLFNNSGHDNLRHLRHGLLDFERIYGFLPDKAKDEDGFLLDLFSIFYVFFSEIRSGNLKPEEIMHMASVKSFGSVQIPDLDGLQERLHTIVKKHGLIDFRVSIFDTAVWFRFFDKGLFCSEDIVIAIESSHYFADVSTPSWKKLWWWINLTDEEFPQILESVRSDFISRSFDNINVFMHVVGIFIRLSEEKAIDYDVSEILRDSKKYIDDIYSSGAILQLPFSDSVFRDRSWDGLGYHAVETKEFCEVRDYLGKVLTKAKNDVLPEKASDLLLLMTENAKDFALTIGDNNPSPEMLYRTPVFQFVSASDFVAAYDASSNDMKYWAAAAFEERYKFSNNCKYLREERLWLDAVISEAEARLAMEVRPVARYHLKELQRDFQKAAGYLDENIKALDAQSG